MPPAPGRRGAPCPPPPASPDRRALAFRSLPADTAAALPVAGDGGTGLMAYRLHAGAARGPAVLLGHCCGFAAGSYRPLLERLAAEVAVYAFDARGHGGSDKPAPGATLADGGPAYAADRFARDLAAVTAAVRADAGPRPLHYAGHSLGGAAAMRLAVRFGAFPWDGAILFEPPIFPDPATPTHAEAQEKNEALAARTRRRTEWFESPAAYAEFIAARRAYDALDPEFQRAHVRATLAEDPAGGWRLACPKAVEAAIFDLWGESSTWDLVPAFPRLPPGTRFRLVAGDPEAGPRRDWITGTLPLLAARLPQAEFRSLADRGHLMVFEDPAQAVALIRGLWGPSPN